MINGYDAGVKKALGKLALLQPEKTAMLSPEQVMHHPVNYGPVPTAVASGLVALPFAVGGAMALPELAGPALAAGGRAVMPLARGAGRGIADTGRHLLNTMRASPKTTTAIGLGSAALSALNGDSPTQQVAKGLTAPVEWMGGGAAAGAVANKVMGAAGNALSRAPGARALASRFPGMTNFSKALGHFGTEMGAFEAMSPPSHGAAPAPQQAAPFEWGPPRKGDGPMTYGNPEYNRPTGPNTPNTPDNPVLRVPPGNLPAAAKARSVRRPRSQR